jgi:hypothetical protein
MWTNMPILLSILNLCTALVMSGCATSSPFQKYSESRSAFDDTPALMSHSYRDKDIYRIYHRASSGFVSMQSIPTAAEQRAEAFAQRQDKSIVVLGEQISQVISQELSLSSPLSTAMSSPEHGMISMQTLKG